jgi:hypothetical protein
VNGTYYGGGGGRRRVLSCHDLVSQYYLKFYSRHVSS